MNIDKQLLKSTISSKKDIALKTITDIVAYKIFESPENLGERENYFAAVDTVVQYISENFRDLDSFKKKLLQLDEGMSSINQLADIIYDYYQEHHFLSFEVVKKIISAARDIDLKTITDIVAYKIYQSSEDKGGDLNFLSAETFVAHYVSENFKDFSTFKEYLSTLGKGHAALEAFAQIVFTYYYRNDG